jgi:hypothetical protein
MAFKTRGTMNTKNTIPALILIVGILPVFLYIWIIGPTPFPQADETIRQISFLDQTMVVITAFVAKPLYMLTSLALAWILRDAHRRELVALRWGLLAFFLGEAFCAVNYIVFHDTSIFSEFLHSYGMVVAFGFISYALLEGLDRHIIQYSDPRKHCALLGLCRECVKHQDAPCRMRQFFQLLSLLLLFSACIPLLAEMRETSYFSVIYGTTYNYIQLKAYLLFEIRYCPLMALTLFMAAFMVLFFSKERQIPDAARILVSAGIGALSFGIFRLFLNSVFEQNLAWAAVWEEISEFSLMVILAYVLWSFRKSLHLFSRRSQQGAPA